VYNYSKRLEEFIQKKYFAERFGCYCYECVLPTKDQYTPLPELTIHPIKDLTYIKNANQCLCYDCCAKVCNPAIYLIAENVKYQDMIIPRCKILMYYRADYQDIIDRINISIRNISSTIDPACCELSCPLDNAELPDRTFPHAYILEFGKEYERVQRGQPLRLNAFNKFGEENQNHLRELYYKALDIYCYDCKKYRRSCMCSKITEDTMDLLIRQINYLETRLNEKNCIPHTDSDGFVLL